MVDSKPVARAEGEGCRSHRGSGTTRPVWNDAGVPGDRERLTTTGYVVLGIIALRGPSTSYDIKRAIGRSVGYFWPFPHAQLYREPRRLAELGYLSQSQEDDGRRRITYSISPEGLEAIQAWLRTPTDEVFQLRNLAEIKLFFSELSGFDNVLHLAEGQVEAHERRLAEYSEMFSAAQDSPRSLRFMPLALGIELERAALAFWRDLHQVLEDVGEDQMVEALRSHLKDKLPG